MSVNRSDTEDPKGGTVEVGVNRAVMVGLLSFEYTETAVVAVSLVWRNDIRDVE